MADPIIPGSSLSSQQLGAANSVLSQYGVNVSGGSTVNASPQFMTSGKPNASTRVYLGYSFDRSAYLGGGSGQTVGKVYDPDRGSFVQSKTGSAVVAPGSSLSDVDYNTALGIPLSWSEAEKRDFISKGILYKMPGFNADMGAPELMDAWKSLVDSSVEFSQNSGKNWSPQDVMNSYANDDKNFGTIRKGDWLYDAATGEKIKYVGPRTKTTTSKNVNLSSYEDVKALTTQMLTELLGRAPTMEEVAQYKSTIGGYEKANPEVTTTTSTLNDMGETVSQSSTTEGGVSSAARQQLIQDQATNTPEYGKFQSGTTYFNALMQMLGG